MTEAAGEGAADPPGGAGDHHDLAVESGLLLRPRPAVAPVPIEDLRCGELRRVAELVLQFVVGEHRAVAHEVDLLRPVLTESDRVQHRQGGAHRRSGDGHDGGARTPADVGDGHDTVTGQVVGPGAVLEDAAHQASDDVTVPDENERGRRTPDGEKETLLEQVGDLIGDAVAENGARTKDELLQLRVIVPVATQHLLDEALVARIGERVVAAQGIVLAQPFRVVGVIPVRGAAAHDDHFANARPQATLEHVLRAAHVDRVQELVGHLLPGRDDGGEMNDGVDLVLLQGVRQAGIANVADGVLDAGLALRGRNLADIGGNDRLQTLPLGGERSHQFVADVTGGSGNQNGRCVHGDSHIVGARRQSSAPAVDVTSGGTKTETGPKCKAAAAPARTALDACARNARVGVGPPICCARVEAVGGRSTTACRSC